MYSLTALIRNALPIFRLNIEAMETLDFLFAKGKGLAIAILDELCAKKCLFVVTTHYPEIKEYSAGRSGLVNARMAFDKESLKPLFRLEIGEAGESCALYIAEKLGMPRKMLERAHRAAYGVAGNEFGTRQETLVPDKASAAPSLNFYFALCTVV